MKAGILTFHHAHNYGTVLQAYALREYLRAQGVNAEIINYRNDILKKRYAEKLSMPEQQVTLKHLIHPKALWRYLCAIPKAKYAQEDWSKQCKKFNDFIDNVLLEGKTEEILASDLSDLDYDVFVSGSDQVWECGITGGVPDNAYFLDFTTSAKKIAYGASMRTPWIPEQFSEYYSRTIKSMDAVSVREQEIASMLQEICLKKIYHVLDPSLLLDADIYRGLEVGIDEKQGGYVFAYFLAENPGMMECAELIAEKLGLPLVELHYYTLKSLKGHNVRADLGPREFLSYIDNAAFVITNSFHGTIFSILFHKKFYSYFKEDTRKKNLLGTLGFLDRKIWDIREVDISRPMDYGEVDRKLERARLVSYSFLKTECISQESK